jgi:hypothetical protein
MLVVEHLAEAHPDLTGLVQSSEILDLDDRRPGRISQARSNLRSAGARRKRREPLKLHHGLERFLNLAVSRGPRSTAPGSTMKAGRVSVAAAGST